MRRLVMFVLPLLCSGALVFGLATSLRKISNQSHDMLPSFDEESRFHVQNTNLTNLGRFELFYFKVRGVDGCPLPEIDDAAFFWGSGEIWLGDVHGLVAEPLLAQGRNSDNHDLDTMRNLPGCGIIGQERYRIDLPRAGARRRD